MQETQQRVCSADVEPGRGANGAAEEAPATRSKLCGVLALPCGALDVQQQQQQQQQGGGTPPVGRQASHLQLVPSVPWWYQVHIVVLCCCVAAPTEPLLLPCCCRCCCHCCSHPGWLGTRAWNHRSQGIAPPPLLLLATLCRTRDSRVAPLLPQVWVLSKRMFKQWIRNPAMLISEISQ